jgi:regulator of protease activity HflC (stomatin/prohibitin superfamily)
MAANRDRVAQAIQSQAEAEEVGIKGKADSMSKTILAFAERRAQEIRNKGDLEAAQFIRQMNVNPDLAVFLKNIDLLRDSLAKKATLVIPFSAPGMGVFSPNALDNLRPGQIPGSNMEGVTGKPRSDAGERAGTGTPVAAGSAAGEGR